MEPTSSPAPPAVRMESITKRFPGIVANQNVNITVQPATFHAVIGENGAGKSTLLNVLYGRYRPDEGRVLVDGQDVTQTLRSPADAIRYGLGLVSQHYALIPALTVMENIVLGAEPAGPAGVLKRSDARDRIHDLTERLELPALDLDRRADQVSIAMGQKIEIVKALFRGTKILLLDEPTATLAPQEADSLFSLLRTLLLNGTTIIFVTHKLREVMTYSRNVTVLRAGRNAGDFVTGDTSPEELLAAMIGPRERQAEPALETNQGRPSSDAPAPLAPRPPVPGKRDSPSVSEHATPGSVPLSPMTAVLTIENLSVRGRRGQAAVRNASLEVNAGEILGVAGVDGSGQRELAEAVVGLSNAASGRIELALPGAGPAILLNPLSVRRRQAAGVAYIPEDRHRRALALDFSVAENYLMGHETQPTWGGGIVINQRTMTGRADKMVQEYDVRMGTRDARSPARTLSGGNQQKIVIARAIDSAPGLLVASQPTRGLDVEAARFVYRTMRAARARGLGILLFSLDLDEILELSDRIAVMFNGEIVGIMPRGEATPEGIGALMTGAARAGDTRAAKGGSQ